MPHNYKEMPPLWQIEEVLELTDEHPSGLWWKEKDKPVTRRHKPSGYYEVSIDNEVYAAHRVVYYLRTGKCPDNHSVKHHASNAEKDNRKELMACYQTKPQTRKPSWSWN